MLYPRRCQGDAKEMTGSSLVLPIYYPYSSHTVAILDCMATVWLLYGYCMATVWELPLIYLGSTWEERGKTK